ncbi:MAG: hypothetical protein ABI895_31950 [Deltaproteobacteria bacterium]
MSGASVAPWSASADVVAWTMYSRRWSPAATIASHSAENRRIVRRAGLRLVAMTWHAHPWGLSFYTPLVGGAPGAAGLGLNRTFWGYATGALQSQIDAGEPPPQ